MKICIMAIAFTLLTAQSWTAAYHIGQRVNQLGLSKPDIARR